MVEQELAIRCARKDKEAQKELYKRYSSRILALCRRYSLDASDAEDLMQDSFIRIFKNIDSFRWTRPGSLYSWMSRVAINLAFDSYKKRRNLIRQLIELDKVEQIPDDSELEDTSDIPLEVLEEMIDSLPEGYRTVFKMYCIDGLSHKEIADLLRIKEKSSSASLSRARALLSSAIRQYWKDMDKESSDESWLMIQRKMRRADVTRNIIPVLVLLIPLMSLMFWKQSQDNNIITSPYIAQIPEDNISIILQQQLISPRGLMGRIDAVVNDNTFIFNEIDEQVGHADKIEDNCSNPASVSDSKSSEQSPDLDEPLIEDNFSIIPEQVVRIRPKISFSFRAGSGSGRRNGIVTLESSPYIEALTYMNAVDPSDRPSAISNSSNAIPWFTDYKSSNEEEVKDTEEIVGEDATSHYLHDLPVTFGLNARIDLTSRFGAECGLEYTYMHSRIETESGQLSQTLHFIGIPVRFDAQLLSWNGLDLYTGLGIKAEKCVTASHGEVKCEERSLQWSAGTFAGIQYSIGRRTHIYFQPELSYCFTKTDLITYRTENPMTFSLNAGIRLDL